MWTEDVRKIALITKFGLFDWIVMPFNLKNAISIFLRTMIEVYEKYMDKILKVFVDDLNIHNMTWEDHLEHLWFVLLKLREVNLKLSFRKCEFAKTSIGFIGHVVSRDIVIVLVQGRKWTIVVKWFTITKM